LPTIPLSPHRPTLIAYDRLVVCLFIYFVNDAILSYVMSIPEALMRGHGMTAEVFLTAFKTLSKKEQDIFFTEVLKDKRLREDLVDIAIAESRENNKSRSFREFLKEHAG